MSISQFPTDTVDRQIAVRAKRPIRRILRQIHLWIGVTLCLPLGLLGLTGSLIILLTLWNEPAIRADAPSASAISHSLDDVLAAASEAAPEGTMPVGIIAPRSGNEPFTVRLGRKGQAAKPGGMALLVDPVTLEATKSAPTFMRKIVQLHANLLLDGRTGRSIVGWFGVAMMGLGISGLVLWWPGAGRWRQALTVRKGAGSSRFLRDLHAVIGFAGLSVLLIVSLTGVCLAFPDTVGRIIAPGSQRSSAISGPAVRPIENAEPIGIGQVIDIARAGFPGNSWRMVALPTKPTQAFRVMLENPGKGEGAPMTTVFIDPWKGVIIATLDPGRLPWADALLTWMHPLHEGAGLGPVWRALVFVCGLLPPFLAASGVAMWLMRRSRRKDRFIAGVDRHSDPRSENKADGNYHLL